jgi:predicted  nucleic acid-binding Zn-ribbon protein
MEEKLNRVVTDVEVLKNKNEVSQHRIKNIEGEIKGIQGEIKHMAQRSERISAGIAVLVVLAPLVIQVVLG